MGTELQLNEVNCTKSVSGESFEKGLQEFSFSIGRPSAWIPSQSYFRFKLKLTAGGGVPSYLTDRVALVENVCSALYNNIYFRAGGQDISSILSYIPQAAAARMRLNKSLGWQKSIGFGAYMIGSDFNERSKKVSAGPYDIGYDSNYVVTPTGHLIGSEVDVSGVRGNEIATFTQEVDFSDGKVKVGDVLVVHREYRKILEVGGVNGSALDSYQLKVGGEYKVDSVNGMIGWYILSSSKWADDDEQSNEVYVLWQPPIAIFEHDQPMGAGDYRFSLNPNTNYKLAGIESKDAKTIGSGAGQVDLVVEDVKFYAATIKMEIPSKVDTLSLMECQIQSKVAVSGGQSSYQFTIPPSTMALSVFVQANEAGNDTRYSPSVFKTTDGSEKSLSQIQITYSNVSKPNTQWDGQFKPDSGVNTLQQRYVDTMRECNLIDNPGGTETFRDFLDRGMLVHYSFLRDQSDKSTQVQVSCNFGTLPPNSRVYLVSHFSRMVELTTSDGQIVSVRGLDA